MPNPNVRAISMAPTWMPFSDPKVPPRVMKPLAGKLPKTVATVVAV